ncbi:hypothetical protein O3P69_000238 [Scylla paramamosain]|uniref:GDNF/GAS1 domain-containing protein n=1 Tax=Scylla paramamosain TaxID=85552 RepID=A0AAW0UYC2_SCYPA
MPESLSTSFRKITFKDIFDTQATQSPLQQVFSFKKLHFQILFRHPGGSHQPEHQTLNCLLAKQLCEEDSNCSAILKVIPTLCGPELVACSTVTVSRCQAALKTLVQFSWFQPTCLCREPRLDPQCNAFRDLLFDHPCVFIIRKDVDLHPLHYIPTCHVASDICRESPWCQQQLDMNPDRENCLTSWLKLRETPLLGCICPDNKDKRCGHLYSLVNENPCLGERYPGRVAAMSRVAAALGSPLSQTVSMPTAAATHIIISTSQADPLYPLSTKHHYLQHLPVTSTCPNTTSLIDNHHRHHPIRLFGHIPHSHSPVWHLSSPHENESEPRFSLPHHTSARTQTATEPHTQHQHAAAPTNTYSHLPGTPEAPYLHKLFPYTQHLPAPLLSAPQHLSTGTQADHNVSLDQLKYVAGTCHEAFEGCMANSGCRSKLEEVSSHCEAAKCQKEDCRSAIKNIYKYLLDTDQELALKIALCVCRDSSAKNYGKCLRGQRRLHPPCAIMSDSASANQCHSLGRECRGDRVCRYQLEHYELSCAADTVTGRCAGHHRECTKAMLGLLGTNLHTNCACKVTAFQDINQCLAWKRLIWGNPCVVEAQLTYHLKQLGINADPLISFTDSLDARVDQLPAEEETLSPQLAVVGGANRALYSRSDSLEDLTEEVPRPVGVEARKVASTAQSDHTHPNAAPAAPFATFTTSATNRPENYCEVRHHSDTTPHIIEEGEKIRLYDGRTTDCSTLCICQQHGQMQCMVLECTKEKACETTSAVYNHNSPAYQVSRGDCICYSGDFVCQRPREEDFNLPMGLFLMLGFSKKEEALLKSATGSGVAEAIPPLQQLFRSIAINLGEDCQLELIHHTENNVVLQARHSKLMVDPMHAGNVTYSQDMLHDERDRCEEPIHRVGAMFQHRSPRIHHDVRLSLFVLAEVIDNVPDHQRISNGSSGQPSSLAMRAYWWAWLAAAVVVLAARFQASNYSVAVATVASDEVSVLQDSHVRRRETLKVGSGLLLMPGASPVRDSPLSLVHVPSGRRPPRGTEWAENTKHQEPLGGLGVRRTFRTLPGAPRPLGPVPAGPPSAAVPWSTLHRVVSLVGDFRRLHPTEVQEVLVASRRLLLSWRHRFMSHETHWGFPGDAAPLITTPEAQWFAFPQVYSYHPEVVVLLAAAAAAEKLKHSADPGPEADPHSNCDNHGHRVSRRHPPSATAPAVLSVVISIPPNVLVKLPTPMGTTISTSSQPYFTSEVNENTGVLEGVYESPEYTQTNINLNSFPRSKAVVKRDGQCGYETAHVEGVSPTLSRSFCVTPAQEPPLLPVTASLHLTAAMDMLQSANSAILYTKSSIDNFSSGLDDLADSVGVGPFLALVAGSGGGGGRARQHLLVEHRKGRSVLWVAPLVFHIPHLARGSRQGAPEEEVGSEGGGTLAAPRHLWSLTAAPRRDEVGSEVMKLVEVAIKKYFEREDQQRFH